MDVALSKTCSNFDERYYASIQTAYRLLGKTQVHRQQLTISTLSFIKYSEFKPGIMSSRFEKAFDMTRMAVGYS